MHDRTRAVIPFGAERVPKITTFLKITKITTFLKIKLLVSNSFLVNVLSDIVSEFRQTVRQVLSGIQTIALSTL